jgi:hypothetical protein
MADELDPAEALALAKGARERVAARGAAAPRWYAPLYGLMCGVIVAGGGTRQPMGSVMAALGIVMVGLLYAHWQQMTGLGVNGYRKGRTRTIAVALAAAMVVLMLGGLALRTELGLEWGPLACGALGAVLAWVASAAWDRAWRAQITDDAR